MQITYFLTHPIQYQSPLIRHLYANGVDIEVCYASDANSRSFYDAGFGKKIVWDIPLLEGYPHRILNRDEPLGRRAQQVAHYTRQLDKVIQGKKPGAIWVHGWAHPFNAAVWSVALRHQIPLMLRGETFIGCVRGGRLKKLAHMLVFTRRFRKVAAFLAVGTLNRQMYRAYGVPSGKIFDVPYAVDNFFFQRRCLEAAPHREQFRAALGIESGRPVILFCAKLIAVKDPATLIRAVGRLVNARQHGNHVLTNAATAGSAILKPVLLMVGDGALKPELEALADEVAPGLVKFLGFRNQTELPALYDLCDLFVLPSIFEPWGLVVNEVMNAGKPVIVSDKVGSGSDLVRPGVNGDVFRAGDVDDLYAKMGRWLQNDAMRVDGGLESLKIIQNWGFVQDHLGLRAALNALRERVLN